MPNPGAFWAHRTAEQFKIGDVTADKAYLSEVNLQAIADIGGATFIPFKSNSLARRAGVWNTAYRFFHLHRETFLTHYNQRSNVESTFSAIKRKFGDSVKAKNVQSMKVPMPQPVLPDSHDGRNGNRPKLRCTKSPALALNVVRA